MSFATPWALTLLVPFAVAAWRLLRRGRKRGIRFSAVSRLPERTAGWRARLAALTPYLLLAGLALLTLAAARPRTALSRASRSVDALAIAMTVDVSGSMSNTDLTPRGMRPTAETTRLATVKRLFAEFVRHRPDDLIGLVTFGGYASSVAPLTADHEALLHALKGVEIPNNGDVEEQNTAMGDGLATAVARLKDAKPTSKIVILLSDGVSNTGAVTPEEATEAAAKLGVKVYVIGIGVVPEVVEVGDFFGSRRVRTADLTPDQLVRLLGFDERQLKSVADKTGGLYFPVADKDGLEKALAEIDKLETTELEADVYGRWQEHFAYFLLVGALLVLAAVSLSMA